MAQSENATPSALINQIPEATSSATFTPNVVGPTIIPTLMQPDQTVSSAKIRQPLKIIPLTKSSFMSTEEITAVVAGAGDYELDASLTYQSGDKIDLLIEKESNVDFATLRIPPSLVLKPGKYTLKVSDQTGSSDSVSFSWGNLAINLEKTVYQPQEAAKINFTVADNLGKPVCNAKIAANTLRVRASNFTNPEGSVANYSSEDGSIKTSSDCGYLLEFALPSDVGTYELTASATTSDGQAYTAQNTLQIYQHSISIQRKTKTIINPRSWQKMGLEIFAQEDFSGTISDTVPDSIDIATPDDESLQSYSQISTQSTWHNKGSILGVAIPPLALPFAERHVQTLGFGDNIKDPKEQRLYSQYNLAGHDGIDYNLSLGTPVLSADSGMVVLAGDGDYGTTIVLQHDWGKSYYGHLSKIEVTLGQRVSKGQQIGMSGNTGLSTGAHLHFGIKPLRFDPKNGYYGKINPLPYLEIPENQVSTLTYTSTAVSKVKKINWNVNLKKGETISLGYQYKTPPDPSTAYLLGPISYIANIQLPTSNFQQDSISDNYLYQILAEYYEIQGASFNQTQETLEMQTIDPLLFSVPSDYPPRKPVLNQNIKGQYADLILYDNPPSFQMNYASQSAIPNWLKLTPRQSSGFTLKDHPEGQAINNQQLTISNQQSWSNVYPSVDLTYETYDGYINQKLIVNEDKAEKTFQFQLEKSDNLSVEDYSGHLLVKDKQTQEEFFLLRFPQGIDAQNQRIDYKYKLENDTLTLYPNRFWQYQKAVYPITIYAPVNVIAWSEALVQVGENCPEPTCGKDGDIWTVRPTGWHWGSGERGQQAIVKTPKVGDIWTVRPTGWHWGSGERGQQAIVKTPKVGEDQRREYETKTLSWQDVSDEPDYETAISNLSSNNKDRLSDSSGLVRYGINYTLLVNSRQLSILRDKKKNFYPSFIDAKKNPFVIRKKSRPSTSIIPDDRRLAYQPERKSLIAWLFKKIAPKASALTINTNTIGSAASRTYTTIVAWESARQGTLTTDDRREIGVMYNDSTFSITATDQAITGSTTDSTRYMHLTVAPGERHNGTTQKGVLIQHDSSTNIGNCMSIQDGYTIVEWIKIDGCKSSLGATNSIRVVGAASVATTNVLIQNVIISNFDEATDTQRAIRIGTSTLNDSVTVRNSLIYDGDQYGIMGESSNAGDTATIENVTTDGMSNSGGDGISDQLSIFSVKNTISMNNAGDDFVVDTVGSTMNNNLCEDNASDCGINATNVTCTACQTNKTRANQFVSVTAGSEDFHLKSGADAIDTGTNLVANFANDIDDNVRTGPWDIGADEYPYRLTDSQMRHGKYFGSSDASEQPFTF